MALFRPRSTSRGPARGRQPSGRLGLEIFVLAGFAAIIPMLVIAAVVFLKAEDVLEEQARAALRQDAIRTAQLLQARLQAAGDELARLGATRGAQYDDQTGMLEAYAVLDNSGNRLAGSLNLPASLNATLGSGDVARLVADTAANGPAIYIGRRIDDITAAGLLDVRELLRGIVLGESQTACLLVAGSGAPAGCAGTRALDAATAQRPGDGNAETFTWELSGESHLVASAALTDSPGLHQRNEYSLTIAQPQNIVFGAIEQLRGLYIPVLVTALALALIGAFAYSRRILLPLMRMLDVTRELTRRDVWGRADLRRRDQFSNVAYDLQHMADHLAQQFNARETLSQIDQAILAGADTSQVVQFVLQHIVESVPCRRAVITLLGSESDSIAVATMMSRGHPVTRSNEITLAPENREWLSRHADGLVLSGPPAGAPCEPFVGADTPHTYVLPILVQGKPAAAVSIMATNSEIGSDELQKIHVRDLAGRLAVALEVVTRSEALQRKAYFDDLTGLPNRDFCFERLDNAIKQAKNTDSFVAVMFIDLDGFKAINDSMGHIAGDELIRQAAWRLSKCCGEAGTIGRLGGDEFAIVLPYNINTLAPEALAERMLAAISQPFQIGQSEIHLSASVGVARYPVDGDTRVELLRKADTAMYSAKEAGRGRKIDYSNTMGFKVDARMRLEGELRRAIDNDELCVYYQPQMDMRTGRVLSAEALIRWNHPERGLVLPGEFVPIAEDSGYINVLGGWIMSAACRQLSAWKQQGLGIERVSVNVSAGQFRRNDFIDVVESSLFELQFASNALEIELTERVFVEDITQARKTLAMLKSLGVVVSIDDFGTGYSSLGYLKHLTFDAVKVDQSFVHELPGNIESEAIVRSVLAMCHTLDKRVVAEGIETDEQFEFLRGAGVDIGQGYRIGKPMSAEDFAEYVRTAEVSLDETLNRHHFA